MTTDDSSLAFASYWRNSLADAEAGAGALQQRDIENLEKLSHDQLSCGTVKSEVVELFFRDERDEVELVDVVLRPFVYDLLVEHGRERQTGLPTTITPVVSTAKLDRSGLLYPLPQTVIPRDLLEPLDRGDFSIGSVIQQDKYLTQNAVFSIPTPEEVTEPPNSDERATLWRKYLESCRELLSAVCDTWQQGADHLYLECDYGYLIKKDSPAASRHILALYDHIRTQKAANCLFQRYASTVEVETRPSLNANAAFSQRLAHASDTFALAPAQRSALAHAVTAEHGEIITVNGPPGTGKTTLLLSVVASLWAEAALAEGKPPVIFAASTNNQAVTNIIDAFGKDFAAGKGPLAGRWLPEITSFGSYFPSEMKGKAAAALYQTRSFFDKVESEAYVIDALNYFLTACRTAFPDIPEADLNLPRAIKTLHNALCSEAAKLRELEASWGAVNKANERVEEELGSTPSTSLARRRGNLEATQKDAAALAHAFQQWTQHQASESLWLSMFSWLAPVAHKRALTARALLEPLWPDGRTQPTWHDTREVHSALLALQKELAEEESARQLSFEQGKASLDAQQRCFNQWRAALRDCDLEELSTDTGLEGCDASIDTSLRFNIFRLATHYWEGRWLEDMLKLLPDLQREKARTGQVAVEARWHRRMQLTPCAVSTFFMLPSQMKVSRHNGSGFTPDYLYDFIDLLIVDEAGQVLPDVAGASFSLAKKALVIGDVMQIEPIWSIAPTVDIGNLFSSAIIPEQGAEQRVKELKNLGKLATSGSVMRIAQTQSRYHPEPDMERGLYLYEHRRCFDDIINYCNVLCYQGKLQPKRGRKPETSASTMSLPALGYLHIPGKCLKSRSGSRSNPHEAEVIAAWLSAQRPLLEQAYGRPLHEIVAVVTPFSGQTLEVKRACQRAGIPTMRDKGNVTVGTVHSLQGAERPIIIFSPTYSKHADGQFIDDRPSMLNVAVSRAKDSFLVFGDLDTFASAARGSPRKLLSQHLGTAADNELVFEIAARRDLQRVTAGIRTLRDAAEHDEFLLGAISKAQQQIDIVSPWLILSRIREIGAYEKMKAATERGVKITIYTDAEFNKTHIDANRAALERAVKSLSDIGVNTVIRDKVHSKILLCDDRLYCIGSFNWFSARRDHFARHETSTALWGKGLSDEIEATRLSLMAATS